MEVGHRRSAALALAALWIAATTGAQASKPSEPAVVATAGAGLELRIDPLVDLYYWVRALAADRDAALPEGYAAAVMAARGVQGQLGSFGGWGPLDSQVFDAADAAELLEGFSSLPEPYERRGRSLSIRDEAVSLATALAELQPGFEARLWPTRRAELETRMGELEAGFMPKHREALAFMLESLGIADPGVTVPMYLVTSTNPPGAMTYHLYGGRQASVLDVTVGGSGGLLSETILHEATHTLDLASQDRGSAFQTMRGLLADRGLTRSDKGYHDIPHTLMFVQAEETMRRLYNPHHVAYGDATDLYERSGAAAIVEREIWPRYLDGEMTLDEALRTIVDRLVPGVPEGPAESGDGK